MSERTKILSRWRSALAGGAFCAITGVILLAFNGWPVQLSYDLTFLIGVPRAPDEVVIVYMDDQSITDLGQRELDNWDRRLHAKLLNHLTEDSTRLVIFDTVFSEPSNAGADDEFAEAIRRNGKVVLAAALNYQSRPQIKVKGAIRPLPMFVDAAAGWGLAEVSVGPGGIVRNYYEGTGRGPGLPQAAVAAVAVLTGKETSEESSSQSGDWLNYYGPPLTLNNVSYSEALEKPPGFFRGKVVFVGARPKTLKAQDEVDEFRTPFTLWTGEMAPGVEIVATAFLNVLNNNGLTRWAGRTEWLFVLVAGLILGGVMSRLRLLPAVIVVVVVLILLLIGVDQAARQRLWFPWTVVAFVQLPVALAWSARFHFQRMKFDKAVLEQTLTGTVREAEKREAITGDLGIVIPDHELLRCVGRGAYGEVWLARNAIRAFHAVKIVQRRAFPSDQPYEREFRGIQHFMPLSRSHPGFVNILHVGRNDKEGYFFCIMEAADDRAKGQKIEPDSYSPKSLAGELTVRSRLTPEECLRLGLSLSETLEHLHAQKLIHRDIKPGNIIYVNGGPKFADIGLVTGQRDESNDVSLVGTEGYVPPEGPGTPAADVYALGKVLYEACMGRDRQMFPEVPTSVWEAPEESLLRRLNTVIARACETDVQSRYATAAELHAALRELVDADEQ